MKVMETDEAGRRDHYLCISYCIIMSLINSYPFQIFAGCIPTNALELCTFQDYYTTHQFLWNVISFLEPDIFKKNSLFASFCRNEIHCIKNNCTMWASVGDCVDITKIFSELLTVSCRHFYVVFQNFFCL